MLDFKKISLIAAGVLFLSASAEARVCFLAGSDDDSSCLTTPSFTPSSLCKEHVKCDIPAIGASSCFDRGQNYYRPEDCCTEGTVYERCDGEGRVCEGAGCTGYDGNGNLYEACEIGYCGCDASYKEECTANGLEGVGEPCDGLYQRCQCSDKYYTCDADAKPVEPSCNDGIRKYSTCTCPTPDGSTWVTDPDDCCFGFSRTCTNRPSGDVVYRCNTTPTYDCVCGYSYATGTKNSCINGCSDDRYEYKGNIPAHVICNDYTKGITAACGNDCQCEDGYWDFVEECTAQKSTVCADLGYTDTSCSGTWVACPYDVSAKKCLNTGGGYDDENTATCLSGYATTVKDCGSTGSSGWTLGAVDSTGCGKCTPKTCPKVSVYVGTGTSSGSGSMLSVQSTTDNDVDNCGSTGSKGWEIQSTSYYSGDDACYVCKPRNCLTGYEIGIATENDCGSSGSKGWSVEISGTATGDETCGKCIAKQCISGESEYAYSDAYKFYITFTPNGYYAGDVRCGEFALNKTTFCEDYKRQIQQKCDWLYETDVGNLHEYCIGNPNNYRCAEYKNCINDIKQNYENGGFEQIEGYNGSMCTTCTGVFGSSEREDYACI